MKKLFYLIVVLMLVPALVACGATAAEQPSEPPAEVTQLPVIVTDEPAAADTPTPDAGIAALDAILDEINNDAQPGSAGSTLKAAAIAADMLNWASSTELNDDEIRQATIDWLSPKGNDELVEFSMKIDGVYTAYQTLISADSEGLMSDAGLNYEVGQWGYEPYSSIETVVETVGLPEY